MKAIFCSGVLVVGSLASAAIAGPLTLHGSSGWFTPSETYPVEFGISLHSFEHFWVGRRIAVEVSPSETPLVWTVDETNAGDFAFDWADALNWVDNLNRNDPHVGAGWFHGEGYRSGNKAANTDTLFVLEWNHQRVVNFVLDHIEIEQTYWVNFPWLKRAEMQWRMVGSGEIVPEPSTRFMGLLVLFAIVLLLMGRR